MQIQVTKKITSILNQFLKQNKNKYPEIEGFEFMTLNPKAYRGYVDCDEYENESDQDGSTGDYKAIRVNYAPECYAMPSGITTSRLHEIYHKREGGTIEKYLDAVFDELRI